MKKNILSIAALVAVTTLSAQVRIVNNTTNLSVNNSPAFIDASSNPTVNNSTNVGKGLIFPRVDLTAMTAFPSVTAGIPNSFPTRFDGMIVYNTATSGTAGVGATIGTLTAGYWYYENKSATNAGGTWKPLSMAGAGVANTASNGLTLASNDVKLGGNLVQTTTITNNGNALNIAGSARSTTFATNGYIGVGISNPTSLLQVEGSFAPGYYTVNANTVLDDTFHTVNAVQSTSTITLTLPPITGISGREYVIHNKNFGATNIVVSGGGTIEGQTTLVLNQPGQTAQLVAGYAEWQLISNSFSSSTIPSGSNIYNSDGSLTGNRIVGMGSNNLSFSGSGNIGIGTTTTSEKLTVSGGINATGNITGGGIISTGGGNFSGGVSMTNLTATGAATVNSLNSAGGITSNANVTAAGIVSTGGGSFAGGVSVGTLSVSGAATVNSLNSAGGITSNANVTAAGIVSTGGGSFAGGVSVGTLSVSGAATVNSLNSAGGITSNANVTAAGIVSTGGGSFAGGVSVGTLSVSGAATVNSLNSAGGITSNANVTAAGIVSTGGGSFSGGVSMGTLSVSGAATVNSLNSAGGITSNANVTAAGIVSTGGGSFSGGVSMGSFSTSGSSTVGGNLTISNVSYAAAHINTSDRRLKSSIKKMDYGLTSVLGLEPVQYDVSINREIKNGKAVDSNTKHSIGFIAQDLYKVIPEATYIPKNEENEAWGIDYGLLVPVLTKAIQEQQSQINLLKKEVQELKSYNNKIRNK